MRAHFILTDLRQTCRSWASYSPVPPPGAYRPVPLFITRLSSTLHTSGNLVVAFFTFVRFSQTFFFRFAFPAYPNILLFSAFFNLSLILCLCIPDDE